ncbi:MAG: SAM-dependent methyltransferase, partial [Acidobacteriota bacterium]
MHTKTPSKTPGYLPVLLILFALSGCSALIYEVVWYQSLQLAIGSTSVSLGVLLATYMGGLCIGSLWLPRRRFTQHPLKIYAALEAGIALCALLVHLGLPYLSRVYVVGAESGLPGMLLRGLLSAVCMLPRTILMGASLPAIVRWIEGTREGVAWWGFLYGANTLGAVCGCLLAGFWLLRVYNMATAIYVSMAINLGVAAISYLMAGMIAAPAPSAAAEEESAPAETSSGSNWPVYLTIALSGATALGAEVVWTRLLGMLLLATVYIFSIILAVFLGGLAIGSAAGSALLRRVKPQAALGWCQILLALGMAW